LAAGSSAVGLMVAAAVAVLRVALQSHDPTGGADGSANVYRNAHASEHSCIRSVAYDIEDSESQIPRTEAVRMNLSQHHLQCRVAFYFRTPLAMPGFPATPTSFGTLGTSAAIVFFAFR